MSARSRTDVASYGCFAVVAAGPAWLLGKLGHWLGAFISPAGAQYGQWIGWAIAAAIYIPMLIAFVRYERKQRKLAQADQESQLVQEICVTNPRIVEVAIVGNTGPNLAIDIGDETILYLQGQWLYDCNIYGAESPENDEGDERFNGLPAPHSFPCTEFTISRLPSSGEVLRIKVGGDYIQPEAPVDALKPEHEFQPSELFCGSVEEIAGVLDREHASREAR
jgi:hypothetical protein